MENGKLSAYPCDNNNDKNHLGLTKREYFAGLAMQGLLATNDKGVFDTIEDFYKKAAEHSIKLADELLKQLDN